MEGLRKTKKIQSKFQSGYVGRELNSKYSDNECVPQFVLTLNVHNLNRQYKSLQKNDAVSKINKKFISHLTWAKRTPSAAATVQVSHALPAVRFSCLMRGRGAILETGPAVPH